MKEKTFGGFTIEIVNIIVEIEFGGVGIRSRHKCMILGVEI